MLGRIQRCLWVSLPSYSLSVISPSFFLLFFQLLQRGGALTCSSSPLLPAGETRTTPGTRHLQKPFRDIYTQLDQATTCRILGMILKRS